MFGQNFKLVQIAIIMRNDSILEKKDNFCKTF